jgi:hypothetical protein
MLVVAPLYAISYPNLRCRDIATSSISRAEATPKIAEACLRSGSCRRYLFLDVSFRGLQVFGSGKLHYAGPVDDTKSHFRHLGLPDSGTHRPPDVRLGLLAFKHARPDDLRIPINLGLLESQRDLHFESFDASDCCKSDHVIVFVWPNVELLSR